MKKLQRVRVLQDQDPEDPRKAWDNLGTMVCWHRRYELGDEQPKDERPSEYLARLPKGTIVLPLYLFDHSGITISTSAAKFSVWDSAGWDWGQVGFIYVTPAKIRENFMTKRLTAKQRQLATEVLISEVETYDQYLQGDVYGFVVEEAEVEDDEEFMDEDEELEWITADSCWGFYGTDVKHNGMTEHVPSELHKQLEEAARSPEYQ